MDVGDDNYQSIKLNFTFQYFHRKINKLRVATNGFVELHVQKSGWIAMYTNQTNSISGFNYDLSTLYAGAIYYEDVKSESSLFSMIKKDLNLLIPSFVPVNIFIISYENVPSSSSDFKELVSFQIIIAIDSVKSYIALKYYSCLSNVTLLTTPGLYYVEGNNPSKKYNVQNLIKIEDPCFSSNVNSSGTWIFDVSQLAGKI